jgi:adenylate cyclase
MFRVFCFYFSLYFSLTIRSSHSLRHMDLKTGFRTRSILSQPVRRQRGAGDVIGVIQMLNKIDGVFDDQDEEALNTCANRVAEDLNARFTELLDTAEKISSK